MLVKKYYDGTQVHRIISEEVKDYDTIMKILKRFADEPSAQPEIIRCKDCKHYEGGWYCSAWNNSPGFPMVTEEGYCDLAERQEE